MRILLHILTRPEDSLSREIISLQQAAGENLTKVVDLTGPQTDYKQLLENIFAADSIEIW